MSQAVCKLPQKSQKQSHRKFTEKTLIVASHNQGKIREINELLKPFGILAKSASELQLDEPEETGDSFVENAELKALAAAKASGLPALADDSGYSIKILNGDPGIYSARWAGDHKDFALAMQMVECKLQDKDAQEDEERAASFICALTLAWPDGHVETFEGRVDGVSIWPPKGDNGFGYDPIFKANGHDRTFAEMNCSEKQKISHRANAFKQLVDACFKAI
ncbi:MAG: RdgB/HAM1 family non-canonical purine NTP pyrophosphatase [Alphaproteobacteria bacterium]|nr:RdgB/HAM1 family non-canonical purine NTP pyrophosphatase [Alphaproteobacteria bacterium]